MRLAEYLQIQAEQLKLGGVVIGPGVGKPSRAGDVGISIYIDGGLYAIYEGLPGNVCPVILWKLRGWAYCIELNGRQSWLDTLR